MVIPRDSSYLYAAFLSKPESKEDVAMIPTGGLITYDKISREYQIANFEKLTERSLPGNYTSLNTKTCKIETEGVFTLADDISHFEVKPAGNFIYNTISNENEMNLILTTDFKMDKGIMEVLTKELQKSEMLEAVDFDRNEYEVGLRDLVGQKIADDLLARKAAGKRVSVPDGLNKTLFFNQLTMNWDPKSQSFVSEGPIGIGNIGKEEVNRLVDGKIQFKNNRRSTDVVMYLELSPSKWYIFTFKGSTGLMKVYSTNKEFMDALFDVKPGDRKIKAEEGNRGYQYMNGSKNDRTRFLSQFD